MYFCGKVERLIENRMEQTVFNPAQMKILQMMSYIKTPQELDNLENVLSQYFAKKVDEGIDELCDNGSITLDTIESWGNEHLRTSCKCCVCDSKSKECGICYTIL